MFTAIFMSLVGIGLICGLLFILAVHALAFFVALSAGMLAYDTGAGPVGAFVVAVIAGAVAIIAARALAATIAAPWIRNSIAAAYALPAAVAGYHAVHGLSATGGAAEPWRMVFSIMGSIIVAIVAWTRISPFHFAAPRGDARTALAGSTPLNNAARGRPGRHPAA